MISINDSETGFRHSSSSDLLPGGQTYKRTPWTVAASWGRGVALFLGVFTLLNIAGELRYPGFDANIWWIDFRAMEPRISRVILTLAAVFLVAFAVRPRLSRWRRTVTLTLTAVLYVVCIFNVIAFYVLLARGTITAGVWIPFSLFVSMALEVVGIAAVVKRPEGGWPREGFTTLIVLAFCAAAFPLAQMFCFGKTDYRRNADAIVVFGARVYSSGRMSDALADRVRTGCDLYLAGYAPMIVFSGGPGDGDIHETAAMKAAAIKAGVPVEAIITDAEGVNTQTTAENTVRMFEAKGMRRVLAVSHFYHLPRIKMAYQRQGWDVYTVPARESYRLRAMPKYMAREVAALWLYYVRPLAP
ncbi:MAG: YdcF family protein [Phycisphaerae bacterium]|nr:YdcF family protein [Phycisphaerae bacterium]